MMGLPTVHCAVCDKTVDRLVCWHDDCEMMVVFRAECHGASEMALIPRYVLNEGKPNIVEAVAFRTPLIEGPQS